MGLLLQLLYPWFGVNIARLQFDVIWLGRKGEATQMVRCVPFHPLYCSMCTLDQNGSTMVLPSTSFYPLFFFDSKQDAMDGENVKKISVRVVYTD